MEATFFATPALFREWLRKHNAKHSELWVGLHKKDSGRPSLSWPEAVDQALCYGWIDGQRKTIDNSSYAIRFTPRRPGSVWSAKNVVRAEELIRQRQMRAQGRKAFDRRDEEKTKSYSYEQRNAPKLPAAFEKVLRANVTAWTYFENQTPSYRKAATWWIVSAKKEETRRRRLSQLIEDSAHGRTIPPLTRKDR